MRQLCNLRKIKPLMSLLSDYNGIVRKNAAEALKIFQENEIVPSKRNRLTLTARLFQAYHVH